jgi:phasin family protein
MSTLPEQFSAAHTAQFDAQAKFMNSLTRQAFEHTEKMLALNIRTARASIEKSAAAVRQLIVARDPRELLALVTQSQSNFESVLAYSRELFGIASGAPLGLPKPTPAAAPSDLSFPAAAPAQAATAPEATSPRLALPRPAEAPAPVSPAEPATRNVKRGKKPLVAVKLAPAAAPVAKAKPIANAVSKVVAKPATTAKPAAAPLATAAMRPVAVPPIKPVDAAPPPAPVAGKPVLASKQPDTLASKAQKKK